MSTLRVSGIGSFIHDLLIVRGALLWVAVLTLAASAPAPAKAEGTAVPRPAHKVQANDPAAAAALEGQGAQLVADYGGYSLYEMTDVSAGLAAQPGIEIRDEYNLILMNAAKLDTSKPDTQALRKSVGSFDGRRMHLVQFAGPVQPAWREALLATGVQIVTYIPRNAYLVYGTADALAAVQNLAAGAPHIQWEGAYLEDYKIHPDARTIDPFGNPRSIGTSLFAIQLLADAEANPATLKLLDQLKLDTMSRQSSVLNYLNLVVSVTPENLNLIAQQPDVVSIQPYFVPQKYDERQDQIVAGNLSGNLPTAPGYLAWLQSKGFTQSQFTSSGFVVDITDSGIDNGTTNANHPGLHILGDPANPSRVAYNRYEGAPLPPIIDCFGHGTLNAHVVAGYDDTAGFPFADAMGYHFGLGVCPFVQVGASKIFDQDGFFSFPNFITLQSAAYRDGARVSNNSWGQNNSGVYNVDCQEYDSLVRDAQPSNSQNPSPGNQEMVIVFANGNSGPFQRTVGAPAAAKNVIGVGASENVQPMGEPDGCGTDDSEADSANDMATFSSRGPCADGRKKPDIVAPGTHVTGGVPQDINPGAMGMSIPCFAANGFGVCGTLFTNVWPDGQQFFTISTGTSHSAPALAGGCALLRQYFINRFGTPPSAAMTKAYLMNTARYLNGTGANDTLWSQNQGMGEMNLGMAFDNSSRVLRDQSSSDLFTASGQVRTFYGSVDRTDRPVRVTLAWTDAPGNTTGAAYNNNLDLTVTIGGITYQGNNFNGPNSVPGGGADAMNNVESVFLPAGTSGPFTVTVTATDINSDGVPNNATPLDQDFALVIYNAKPPPPQINSILPANVLTIVGQPVTFTVNAVSLDPRIPPPPLSYQWLKNVTNTIIGATSNIFTIASAQLTDSATYSVVVSDVNGSTTSPAVTLTVVPTVSLPFALNNSNLAWTAANTNTPWFGQTNISHDGVASGQSYFVPPGQQCVLRTTNNGPGTLSFWWRVAASDTNAARASFTNYANGYTNGLQIATVITTNPAALWTNQTFYIPAGPQTLEWAYLNFSSPINLTNGAYLDQVAYVPGATLPFIITQPADQGIFGANPVTFSVSANGTPRLTYQWRFDGVPITGATNSSYTILSAGTIDAGLYSVVVSNSYGSVLSAPASLQVVPLVLSGDNSDGQTSATISATNTIGIAAGAFHTLIVKSDGSVLSWGNNAAGQCNPPATLTNAMAVAAGSLHSLAIMVDGTVVGWGENSAGQATPPPGLSNVTALAAGSQHSVALRTDGTVVAWGDNSLGQLNVPSGLTGVVAISAGGDHTVALRNDGTVVAWGANTDPSFNFSGQSTVPWGLANVASVSAGSYHSLAVKADETVVGWGYDAFGETQPPVSLTNAVATTAGNQFSVALNADRTLTGWGNDWNGQVDFPATLTNVTAIAAGDSHSVVLIGKPWLTPQMLLARHQNNQFSLWVQTLAGKNYALESTSSLSSGLWSTVSWFRGNGSMQLFIDPAATQPHQFYRVRQW